MCVPTCVVVKLFLLSLYIEALICDVLSITISMLLLPSEDGHN
jgi:hypothetical protein